MAPGESSSKRAVTVAISGAVLILIAFVFDAAPLFVPGIAFAAIGVAAPAWVWASARGARATRSLQAERVVEDQPLQATIGVRRGRLGLPGAELVDPLAATRVSLAGPLSPIGGGRSADIRVIARFTRRGLHRLEPPSLIVRDPLELARVVKVSAAPFQQLLVLPRTEAVRWLAAGRGRRSERNDGKAHSDALAAVDLDGLRPYRPGTPASRIHWPAVARGAGLLERRLAADGDRRPIVVLDARGSGPAELLDAAVRATASLALELARLGGCGLLLPGERRATALDSGLVSWPAAHARLAMVEGGEDTSPPALGAAGTRLGPVFYVAAQPLDRLPALVAGVTRGAGVLVVPTSCLVNGGLRGARTPSIASFEVAGCRGFLLGARRGPGRVPQGVGAA
jgi:uncharacterized protein (DUF58 family)